MMNPDPSLAAAQPCPCGSRHIYGSCCGPLHRGEPAPTAEALMRSRYSAYVLRLEDYLRDTWHPSTRPGKLDLTDSPCWVQLQVLATSQTGDKGVVQFRAIYQAGDGWNFLEEASDFVRADARWYYLAGKTSEGKLKPGRNDACPCGSGRKFKTCCHRQ